MNKSLAGILGVTVALTLLAGCTAYDRTKDQFTQPVVKDVKKGMSRQQVMQIAGKPSTEVTMVHARGTCQSISLSLFSAARQWGAVVTRNVHQGFTCRAQQLNS